MRPETQALEVHQHSLFRHLKYASFSRNLDQNMPKMRILKKKKAVTSPQRPGLRPRTLVSFRQLGTLHPDFNVASLIY